MAGKKISMNISANFEEAMKSLSKLTEEIALLSDESKARLKALTKALNLCFGTPMLTFQVDADASDSKNMVVKLETTELFRMMLAAVRVLNPRQ